GDWGYVRIPSTGEADIAYAAFSYGGDNNTRADHPAQIIIDGKAALRNVSISNIEDVSTTYDRAHGVLI
ncbi:hypothetical protein RJ41_14695, partial [Alteromonas marina]